MSPPSVFSAVSTPPTSPTKLTPLNPPPAFLWPIYVCRLQIPVGLGVLLDPRLAANPVYGVSALSLAMVTISTGEAPCAVRAQWGVDDW